MRFRALQVTDAAQQWYWSTSYSSHKVLGEAVVEL